MSKLFDIFHNPVTPEIKALVAKLKGMPIPIHSERLIGSLLSPTLPYRFRKGYVTQAERAVHYHEDNERLIEIERTSDDSRFDLVIKNTLIEGKSVDDGKEIIVEVKNWDFENYTATQKLQSLTKLDAQLKKYKATGMKVELEWKGPIPKQVKELCEVDLKIIVRSI